MALLSQVWPDDCANGETTVSVSVGLFSEAVPDGGAASGEKFMTASFCPG